MGSIKFGGQSMVGDLKTVLVRKPSAAFGAADPARWNYTAAPNLEKALVEHEHLVNILRQEGVDAVYHDSTLNTHADAMFVHDPAIVTDFGAIILKMGKDLRNGEEAAMKETFQKMGVPIFSELTGNAKAEGGDTLWLDSKTLIVGRGFRTNQAGIDQLRNALAPKGVDVIAFDLPCDQGKQACLHLQSLISLVDYKKALVYLKFFPVAFLELLEERNFSLIEVPDDEYPSMGSNVLAIKPKVCLTLQGNTKTKERLEHAGCRVHTYVGNEISLKAEGGATCLTRPVWRSVP